jgi:hypothetical protein
LRWAPAGRTPGSSPEDLRIATSVVELGTAARTSRRPGANPLARLGAGVWDLLTSVNFAVLQIILLGIGAAIGMTVRQLPGFAFRSASAYDQQMALIH